MVDFKRIVSEINENKMEQGKYYSDIDYELFLLDKNSSRLSMAIFNNESAQTVTSSIVEILLTLLTVSNLVGVEDLEVELYKTIDSKKRNCLKENALDSF